MTPEVGPGDVIVVHIEDKPAFHARVEEIRPDVKAGWRQIRFQVLSIPRQELTWILEPRQINGDPFTMGGTAVQIERLPDPGPVPADNPKKMDPGDEPGQTRSAQVISFPFGGRPKDGDG